MPSFPVQIQPVISRIQLVDPKTGYLTVPGQQFLQQVWKQLAPTNQVIPCSCANTGNVYTLTPTPLPPNVSIAGYSDYTIFTATASASSTGAVTALVSGLTTVKVYKSNGATQAGNGDLAINSLYLWVYNSALNSGSGGLVIK